MNKIDWKMVIREIMERLFLTQKEVAERCGVSPQSVSNWLNDVRRPGIYAKKKLMEILHSESDRISRNNKMIGKLMGDSGSADVKKLVNLFVAMDKSRRDELLKFAKRKSRKAKPGSKAG